MGRQLGELSQPGDVFLLVGELGAGKTCLTQGIARGLEIDDYVLSPTFVIMRELYGRLNLYHIDLYRLDNIDESIDLGLDDYFYGKGVCAVEWAEKAMSIMPKEHLLIKIDYLPDSNNVRNLSLEAKGQRYTEMIEELNKIFIEKQGKQ